MSLLFSCENSSQLELKKQKGVVRPNGSWFIAMYDHYDYLF